MTPETVQFLTIIGGLLGTLAPVALTHYYTSRGEERRLVAEDRRRWHDQRYPTGVRLDRAKAWNPLVKARVQQNELVTEARLLLGADVELDLE